MRIWGQVVPTLIVNTEMKAALVINVLNRGEARSWGGFRLYLTNMALVPAVAFRVAIFLDNVVAV